MILADLGAEVVKVEPLAGDSLGYGASEITAVREAGVVGVPPAQA